MTGITIATAATAAVAAAAIRAAIATATMSTPASVVPRCCGFHDSPAEERWHHDRRVQWQPLDLGRQRHLQGAAQLHPLPRGGHRDLAPATGVTQVL